MTAKPSSGRCGAGGKPKSTAAKSGAADICKSAAAASWRLAAQTTANSSSKNPPSESRISGSSSTSNKDGGAGGESLRACGAAVVICAANRLCGVEPNAAVARDNGIGLQRQFGVVVRRRAVGETPRPKMQGALDCAIGDFAVGERRPLVRTFGVESVNPPLVANDGDLRAVGALAFERLVVDEIVSLAKQKSAHWIRSRFVAETADFIIRPPRARIIMVGGKISMRNTAVWTRAAAAIFCAFAIAVAPFALFAPVAIARAQSAQKCLSSPTAECLFALALQTADKADSKRRDNVLREIAAALADSGRFDAALRAADKIDNADKRAAAIRAAAVALAAAGRFDDAMRIADKIDSVIWRVSALQGISAALAATGRKTEAKNVFADAMRIADKIGDANKRSAALTRIAIDLAEAGEFD